MLNPKILIFTLLFSLALTLNTYTWITPTSCATSSCEITNSSFWTPAGLNLSRYHNLPSSDLELIFPTNTNLQLEIVSNVLSSLTLARITLNGGYWLNIYISSLLFSPNETNVPDSQVLAGSLFYTSISTIFRNSLSLTNLSTIFAAAGNLTGVFSTSVAADFWLYNGGNTNYLTNVVIYNNAQVQCSKWFVNYLSNVSIFNYNGSTFSLATSNLANYMYFTCTTNDCVIYIYKGASFTKSNYAAFTFTISFNFPVYNYGIMSANLDGGLTTYYFYTFHNFGSIILARTIMNVGNISNDIVNFNGSSVIVGDGNSTINFYGNTSFGAATISSVSLQFHTGSSLTLLSNVIINSDSILGLATTLNVYLNGPQPYFISVNGTMNLANTKVNIYYNEIDTKSVTYNLITFNNAIGNATLLAINIENLPSPTPTISLVQTLTNLEIQIEVNSASSHSESNFNESSHHESNHNGSNQLISYELSITTIMFLAVINYLFKI